MARPAADGRPHISTLGARGGARRKPPGRNRGGGGDAPATLRLLRIGFQGLPGAYSEKATRALLGPNVLPVGHGTFDDTFRALVAGRIGYAVLPIESSLGGSIHANYGLLLRCARAALAPPSPPPPSPPRRSALARTRRYYICFVVKLHYLRHYALQ